MVKKLPTATRTPASIVGFGAALLVGTLFPIGPDLASWLFGVLRVNWRDAYQSFALWYLVSIAVLNYLPWALLVVWLVRQFQLVQRVAPRFQGRRLFFAGSLLGGVYMLFFVAATQVTGGGIVIGMSLPLVLAPTLLVLLVACIRYLYGIDRAEPGNAQN